MDYEFFHSLSNDEAQALLADFLATESRTLESLVSEALAEGVVFDFDLDLLPGVLKWMAGRVGVYRVPVEKDTPSWIRQTLPEGRLEFEDGSRCAIYAAAYYLGECFARLPGMKWTIGDPEYLEKNMPVVAGFRHEMELPPLVVVTNMFARVVGEGDSPTTIDSIVASWRAEIP